MPFSLTELPALLQPLDAVLADDKLMTDRERGSRQVHHIHYKNFLATLEEGQYCIQWDLTTTFLMEKFAWQIPDVDYIHQATR